VIRPVITSSLPPGFAECSGYLDPGYAASLAEFGQPLHLPNSRGWLLKRRILGTDLFDAMGCYPLFTCAVWEHLAKDIEALQEKLVSVAVVADSFGNYDEKLLQQTFERVVPFKSHFVVELGPNPEQIAFKNHRRNARKALSKVSVDIVSSPAGFLNDWCVLYNNLIRRHNLNGIKAFSQNAFEQQLTLKDMVVFRATYQGRTVGSHLWMLQGEVAHSHLSAFSDEGYDLMCGYAFYWEAIRYFQGKVKWLNLGAGAGIQADANDGLTQFKRGWATGSRTAWFCATVLNTEKYAELCEQAGVPDSSYFPAYRQGEFA
jgi:hypothetical protein